MSARGEGLCAARGGEGADPDDEVRVRGGIDAREHGRRGHGSGRAKKLSMGLYFICNVLCVLIVSLCSGYTQGAVFQQLLYCVRSLVSIAVITGPS